MTKDEEKGYIERVLAGDESAYEPLVTENQTKVYRLALRILKNETDAEDAAQEAFLKAYTSLADFRGDSRFSVWLYRLTNNICIDMLRKNKRAVIVPLPTEDDRRVQNSFCRMSASTLAAVQYVCTAPQKRLHSFALAAKEDVSDLCRLAETYMLHHLDRSFPTLDFYKTVSFL